MYHLEQNWIRADTMFPLEPLSQNTLEPQISALQRAPPVSAEQL